MKQRKFVVWAGALILLCFAALLLGCPTEAEEEEQQQVETLNAVVVEAGETKYFSLTTGQRIPDDQKNTTNWDIAFTRTRLILTNSDETATAVGSLGEAKVWYTGKTDFADVTLDDKGADNAAFSTDTGYYVWTGMGAAPTAKSILNVMTFVGYQYGNGQSAAIPTLQGDAPYDPERDGAYPQPGAYTGYMYNGNQYYSQSHGGGSGGPIFGSSNKVYIIKHADGSGYSKVQFTYEYLTSPARDAFAVQYEKLQP
jgi:hypothetical protein